MGYDTGAGETGVIDGESVSLRLRSGRTIWEHDAGPPTASRPLKGGLRADIVVVGAGITGAFIADRLAGHGRRVVVLDRHAPQRASTAASTALLQWEIDAPMLELEGRLGFETAAAIYRRSVAAVRGIGDLVAGLGGRCGFSWRDTVFIAGNELAPADLREERRLRALAGIEGAYLDHAELLGRYGFDREAALVYSGSAEAHPVELARALLDRAVAKGAVVCTPALVTDYSCGALGVTVGASDGIEVEADILVLANGYEMPPFVPARRQKIVSTWALATAPQPQGAIWADRALVWEASDPYLYMRSAPGGRLIVGGEDEELTDPDARDAKTDAKVATLLAKLGALAPAASRDVDAAWAGFFSETDDGLPLIGRVPGQPRCFAAFGYGGNGITFSAMAAEILETLISGGRDPAEEWFAVDR